MEEEGFSGLRWIRFGWVRLGARQGDHNRCEPGLPTEVVSVPALRTAGRGGRLIPGPCHRLGGQYHRGTPRYASTPRGCVGRHSPVVPRRRVCVVAYERRLRILARLAGEEPGGMVTKRL